MDELFRWQWALGFPPRPASRPLASWAAPEWGPGWIEGFDRFRGILNGSQRPGFTGLRIVQIQSAESMEAMENNPEEPSARAHQPVDDFAERFESERVDTTRVCRRLLDDPTSAEDAASEVFLRARRALSSYDPAQPFRPWLRAIASNYCIDLLRRQKTERKLFSAADFSDNHLDRVEPAPDALKSLTRHEERAEVLAAIDSLPAKYRIPLVLRFYRDLDYEAIAEILDVSRNQVGSLLFRAKKLLRDRLELGVDGFSAGGRAGDGGHAGPETGPATDGHHLDQHQESTQRRKRRRRIRTTQSTHSTKGGAKK